MHQLSVDSASSTSTIVSMQIGFPASKSTQTIALYLHEPVFDPLSNNG